MPMHRAQGAELHLGEAASKAEASQAASSSELRLHRLKELVDCRQRERTYADLLPTRFIPSTLGKQSLNRILENLQRAADPRPELPLSLSISPLSSFSPSSSSSSYLFSDGSPLSSSSSSHYLFSQPSPSSSSFIWQPKEYRDKEQQALWDTSWKKSMQYKNLTFSEMVSSVGRRLSHALAMIDRDKDHFINDMRSELTAITISYLPALKRNPIINTGPVFEAIKKLYHILPEENDTIPLGNEQSDLFSPSLIILGESFDVYKRELDARRALLFPSSSVQSLSSVPPTSGQGVVPVQAIATSVSAPDVRIVITAPGTPPPLRGPALLYAAGAGVATTPLPALPLSVEKPPLEKKEGRFSKCLECIIL